MTPPFALAICTRNRPEHLARTLDALVAQPERFPIVVIDQSPAEDVKLRERAGVVAQLEVVRTAVPGLSHARNLAVRHLESEWIAFVDDDCLVEPDWASVLSEEIERHPDVSLISGRILSHGRAPGRDFQPVSVHDVPEPLVLNGKRPRPWEVCLGVSFAVRRTAVERLGGWDERIGPGVPRYPAADDMDFNYRFLRAGESAYVTPRIRVRHDQWRSPQDLLALYEGYSRAWAGFSMKHLRTGDVAGGARLWLLGLNDAYRMTGSAVRQRSRWRTGAAREKWRGHFRGTFTGLKDRW